MIPTSLRQHILTFDFPHFHPNMSEDIWLWKASVKIFTHIKENKQSKYSLNTYTNTNYSMCVKIPLSLKCYTFVEHVCGRIIFIFA